MIKIRYLRKKDEALYRQFLLQNPSTLIHSTLEYRDFLAESTGGVPYYLIALKDGKIVGSLPFFSVSHKNLGTIINSLPWYGSHGGCTVSFDENGKTRKLLLEKYADIVTDSNVLVSTLILTPSENAQIDNYIDILKPAFIDTRIGQISNLPNNGNDLENRLLMTFKQKTRNLVRKSLKQGFKLTVTNEEWAWQFLFNTHTENIMGIDGRPKPWKHFIALKKHIPADWMHLLIASINGNPVAALLLICFNKTVEYFTPVIKHEFRSMQPLSFLIWHGMLRAIIAGYRFWNWGGTWVSQISLHHFKAGWGAKSMPYSYLINARDESVLKIKHNVREIQKAFPFFYIFPFDKLQ